VIIIDLTSPNSDREPYRPFFEHYEKCWGGSFAMRSEREIRRGRELVLRSLTESEHTFGAAGFSTQEISALLFAGSGVANGHAFCDGHNSIAWYDVADYQTELTSQVFVLHELIHAIHYHKNPAFAFSSQREKEAIWRQLITEGIATHASKVLLQISDGEALWGDFLSPQQLQEWMLACEVNEVHLRGILKSQFESSDTTIDLFYAHDASSSTGYRQGYYIGLKVLEDILKRERLSLQELFEIPVQEFKKIVLEIL
jgi:hypothetical protein